MHRKTAYFTGNVQGVGFRYTTQNLALQFDVNGYVRNLPDGRVELVLEGEDDEMDHLVQAIQQRMEGFIKKVDLQEGPATNQFDRFSIRH